MNWKIVVILVIFYFVYLVIGALIFSAIEKPREDQKCIETKKNIDTMLEEVQMKGETISLNTLVNITHIVSAAAAYGIVVNDDFNVTCPHNWNFESAFFFSGTVVTTIGYGNIAPQTQLGRSICILYAIIGIPVFGVMFGALGESISKQIDKLHERIRGKAKRTWVAKGVVILIVLSTFLVFCMIIPAVIFQSVENWSYGESFYYAFITLTTIGFGDFVAGANPDNPYIPVYRIMVYFWILFGLAFMATLISLSSEFFRKRGRKAANRAKEPITEEDGKADDPMEDSTNDSIKDNVVETGKNGKRKSSEPTDKKESIPKHTQSNESLEHRPLNIQQAEFNGSEISESSKAA